jgi:hypothetical protein
MPWCVWPCNMCMCVYIRICMCVSACLWCTPPGLTWYPDVCGYVRIIVGCNIHTYMYTYIYMHTHIYKYTHLCIYIHTHTHIYTYIHVTYAFSTALWCHDICVSLHDVYISLLSFIKSRTFIAVLQCPLCFKSQYHIWTTRAQRNFEILNRKHSSFVIERQSHVTNAAYVCGLHMNTTRLSNHM